MFLIRLLVICFVVTYIIWAFNSKVMKKDASFSKIGSLVIVATTLIYILLAGLSFLVEGS